MLPTIAQETTTRIPSNNWHSQPNATSRVPKRNETPKKYYRDSTPHPIHVPTYQPTLSPIFHTSVATTSFPSRPVHSPIINTPIATKILVFSPIEVPWISPILSSLVNESTINSTLIYYCKCQETTSIWSKYFEMIDAFLRGLKFGVAGIKQNFVKKIQNECRRVHHIIPGDNHRILNLAILSNPENVLFTGA